MAKPMPWIEKIRSKPQKEKIKIIWAVAIIITISMLVVWIISARMTKKVAGDTTLFQTIGRGIKDLKNNFNK